MKCPPPSHTHTHKHIYTYTHTQKVEVLDRGMSTVIVRCHCDVNKLKIFFIKKKNTRSKEALRPVLLKCENFCCYSHCTPFSEKMARQLYIQSEPEAQKWLSVVLWWWRRPSQYGWIKNCTSSPRIKHYTMSSLSWITFHSIHKISVSHPNTQLENLSNITASLPQLLIREFVTTLKSVPHILQYLAWKWGDLHYT
jgi:hypothetical protein